MGLVYLQGKDMQYVQDDSMQGIYYYEGILRQKGICVPAGKLHFTWKQGEVRILSFHVQPIEWQAEGHNEIPIYGVVIDPQYEIQGNEQEIQQFFEQIVAESTFVQRRNVFRNKWENVFLPKRVHPLLEQVDRMIIETDGKAVVENIAYELGYTTRQIEKMFKREYGYGPKMFARMIRLQAALRKMEEDTGSTFAQIAEETGYSDPSHFQREFRRFVGMTPKQFQTEYLRSNIGINLQ